jgi:hypothetical protein
LRDSSKRSAAVRTPDHGKQQHVLRHGCPFRLFSPLGPNKSIPARTRTRPRTAPAPQPPNGGWYDLGFHPDHQHVGSIVFHSMYGGGSAVDNNLLFGDLADAGVVG